jgi:SAM-dependent methyltransferase
LIKGSDELGVVTMASLMAERLRERYYAKYRHPYAQLRDRVEGLVTPGMTLMDAGCGRDVPALRPFIGKAGRLIGIDLVEPRDVPEAIEYYQRDLADTGLPDDSVDIVMSQSVFEHVEHPDEVLLEIKRVLRPGGQLVVLTPSKWDYGSLIAMVIPNRLHPAVVQHVEGRPTEDTFPTRFRCNTEGAVRALAARSGLQVGGIEFVNQYPNYLLFNGPLFFVGTLYERLTTRINALRRLRGWMLFTLRRPLH